MARFADWAKNRVPDAHAGYVEVAKETKPVEEVQQYLVDNSGLQSKSQGIRYRRSPVIEDKNSMRKPARFGSIIKGISLSDDWVQVKTNKSSNLYLPKHIGGTTVLTHAFWLDYAGDDDEEDLQQSHRDENDVLGNLLNRLEGAAKKPLKEPAARPRGFNDMEAFETDGIVPGQGSEYSVVGEKALIRASPSTEAKMRNILKRGDSVELFDWDSTRLWRKCYDASIGITGWMLLDHLELGPLLRPAGFEDCRDCFSPVCAAVLENDTEHLTKFINEGMLVDAVSPGAPAPLILAAEEGQLDCCVCLLQAGAHVNLSSISEGDAKLLIRALSGQSGLFGSAELEAVMQSLSPNIKEIASGLQMKFIVEQAVSQKATASPQGGSSASPASQPKATTSPQDWSKTSPVPPSSASASPSKTSASTSPSKTSPSRSLLEALQKAEDAEDDSAPPSSASSVRMDEPTMQGAEYEVVHDAVWIRAEPSASAAQVGMRKRGQVVVMYEFDKTRTWRKVQTGGADASKELLEPHGIGWMLIRHPKLGDLLKPRGREVSAAG